MNMFCLLFAIMIFIYRYKYCVFFSCNLYQLNVHIMRALQLMAAVCVMSKALGWLGAV